MFEAHFQSFEERGERGESAPRLAALRAELARRGLDGFIVPRADRYQNEYVPPCAERLAWLTGFTGSAGIAIVLADRAAIFVDGRYRVQVAEEVDDTIFAVEHLIERPPAAWIEANLPAGKTLGYSPWLHTVDGAEQLAKACAAAGASLVAVADNPIDAIWSVRAAPPLGAVVLHDLRYAGEEAQHKVARVRAEMQKLAADALVVSDPHAVSWLFNIRGSDVPHTPVVLAFALVPKEGRPALYVDARKLTNDIRKKSILEPGF
jgi:Xaa-Pro aminopeptidase